MILETHTSPQPSRKHLQASHTKCVNIAGAFGPLWRRKMKSDEKLWYVDRVKDFERREPRQEYGVFAPSSIYYRIIGATFNSIHLAERCCAMLNDTEIHSEPGPSGEMPEVDSKRLVMTLKLFALQENLTWSDFGFRTEEIREVNRILEMPLDLRARAGK